MKNIKRILLAFVAVFAAVLLVACGAKRDLCLQTIKN